MTLYEIEALPLELEVDGPPVPINRIYAVVALPLVLSIDGPPILITLPQRTLITAPLALSIGASGIRIEWFRAGSYPDILPTDLSFTPPSHAIKKSRSQNGVTSMRLWSLKPGNGALSLIYTNIPDSEAEDICRAHTLAKGSFQPISIPEVVFCEQEPTLLAYLTLAKYPYLKWVFAGPPQVRSVMTGISTVTAEFRTRYTGAGS